MQEHILAADFVEVDSFTVTCQAHRVVIPVSRSSIYRSSHDVKELDLIPIRCATQVKVTSGGIWVYSHRAGARQ